MAMADETFVTTVLLNNGDPEIELSDYQRILSCSSEGPSCLLNEERLNAEPIADLDLFFERIYNYYCGKGLWCIITKWIFEFLSLGFMIFFTGFFFLIVDWRGLRRAKCGIDAVGSGVKPCVLAKEAIHEHPSVPFTFIKGIIVGYLVIFSICWIFCFLRFFAQLGKILEIRRFYYNRLNVTDREVQTMPWEAILEKVVQVQNSYQLCVVRSLSANDVVMRVMRKENYLIGMINKSVLAFPVPSWVPGAGPAVKSRQRGQQHCLALTKTLEWTLNWCILQSMFDRNFCVRRGFISNPFALKKRLMIFGLGMLLLSPFLLIFMLVFLFLRHAEQFYHHPSLASSRRWSNLSRWIFREFNEVDHLFRHRINNSVEHADAYLKQFPSPIVNVIAKFVSFVAGGFAAVLIIIAFLEESLLEGHIFGRNLFWYAAVFGTVTAISRASISDELQVLDPEEAMSHVVRHTHYMPKRWRCKESTHMIRTEFETLFQYTGMLLLEEMFSIFLKPYLLIFIVPNSVDDILQFISDFTVFVAGVGDVCSLSVFDFECHGNSNYGSPYNAPREQRSSQGKMEKSFLSFKTSYPSWEPNAQGKHFLYNIQCFRKEQMRRHETQLLYSSSRPWQLSPNLRPLGDIHRFVSRDMFYNRWLFRTGCQLDSAASLTMDQNNLTYLLDWYYTSHGDHKTVFFSDQPEASVGDQRASLSHNHVEVIPSCEEDDWGSPVPDRIHSHMEASTSSPIFWDSVLHQGPGHLECSTRSHWWGRSDPNSTAPHASFIEPPCFGHCDITRSFKNFSDRSFEEQDEGHLDWRSSNTGERELDWRDSNMLSHKTDIDAFDKDDVRLNLSFIC